MAEYISKQTAVDAGYLSDWYISSVGDEPPVWTDAHIDELLNDFIVIPKDTKPADVQTIRRGRWITITNERGSDTICSRCYKTMVVMRTDFCPTCGADMRGEENG